MSLSKTILFRVLPESGHINASLGLARTLHKQGHRIVYASVEDYRGTIEAEGFDFYTLEEELIWAGKTRFAAKTIRNPLEQLRIERMRRRWIKAKRTEMRKAKAFLREINDIKPDLVLVDSPFTRFTPCIRLTNTPFAMLESMVALDSSNIGPPLRSYLVPLKKGDFQLRSKVSWLSYYFERWFRHKLNFAAMVSPADIKALCKKTGFPFENFRFDRYFHPSVSTVPEIFLSSKEFDFPRIAKSNQFYANTTVNRDRIESNYDYRFDTVFEQTQAKVRSQPTNRIIYCSLGSMSFRYFGVSEFYERVIQAFSDRPGIDLFLSIGNELNIESFGKPASNVHVFRRVPQLRLLHATDLMITHGGMNSIMECILAKVPMLVYPGTDKIDQPGNGARVVYHGMGQLGKLKKDSSKQIRSKAEQTLGDPNYRENVSQMHDKILKKSTPEAENATVDFIINLCKDSKTKHTSRKAELAKV